MSSSRLFLYTSKSLAQAVAATVVYIYKTFSFCVRSIHVPIYMLNARVFFICFLFVGWIQLRQNVKLVASKIIERHMHISISIKFTIFKVCMLWKWYSWVEYKSTNYRSNFMPTRYSSICISNYLLWSIKSKNNSPNQAHI